LVPPAHAFTYTPVDLEATYTPPDLGIGNVATTYTYNADRHLTQVQRPDGQILTLDYEPTGGRLSTLTAPTGQTTFTYHPTTGQLSGTTAPGGVTLNYTYDGSLLTGTTWTGPVAGSVTRTYDTDFRVVSESVNGANPITFQYDPDSLLTQAGSLSLTRNAQNGLLTGTTVGSVSDTRTYSTFGELSTYQATYSGSPLINTQYTRDALGRITQKIETIGGVTDTYTYGYDLAGRLIDVLKTGTNVAHYDYDANGNRLSVTRQGSGTVSGTYDAQDRLTTYGAVSYTYNANGDLLTSTSGSETTTYTYDVFGNLTAVTLPTGTQIEYVIDGQNRRIGKRVNGVPAQGFLYSDQLKPVAELDGSGNLVSRFVYAARPNVPNYMIKSGLTYRLLTDHLGSVRLVVDTATGTIAQRLDYDEFGQILLDTNPGFQPFSFAGGLYDQHTKLTRFGARDYDAFTGRWTTKDPLLFGGGDTNLYGYAWNSPVRFADPLGLYSWGEFMQDWTQWADIRAAQDFWQESRQEALDRGDWVGATAADLLNGLLTASGLPTVQQSAEALGSIETTPAQKAWAGAKIAAVGVSWCAIGTTQITGRVAGQARTSRIIGLRNRFGEHFYTDKDGFFFAIDKTFHRLHIGPWKGGFRGK
jgi:RHS repeat-associated protein